MFMVRLSVPELGDTDSQDEALFVILQLIFDVIVSDVCPPDTLKFNVEADTDRTGSTPACVTLIVG